MIKPQTQVLAVVAATANSDHPLESLDAIFASAVFDIAVSVLFLGDAITAHLITANTQSSRKCPVKQWQASELYDIKALWVLASDLQEQQLTPQDLAANVTIINDVPNCANFKHVLSL